MAEARQQSDGVVTCRLGNASSFGSESGHGTPLGPSRLSERCERKRYPALPDMDAMGGDQFDERLLLGLAAGEAGEVEHRRYSFKSPPFAERGHCRVEGIGEVGFRQLLATRLAGRDPGGDHQRQMLRDQAGLDALDGRSDNALRQFLAAVIGDLRRAVGERGVGETLGKCRCVGGCVEPGVLRQCRDGLGPEPVNERTDRRVGEIDVLYSRCGADDTGVEGVRRSR